MTNRYAIYHMGRYDVLVPDDGIGEGIAYSHNHESGRTEQDFSTFALPAIKQAEEWHRDYLARLAASKAEENQ